MNRVEGVFVCQIEADKHATDIIVIHSCNLSKSLLASGVPDEHSDCFSGSELFTLGVTKAQLNGLDFEVPREGWLSAMVMEHILDVPLDQACLSNHRLANANDLELLLLC